MSEDVLEKARDYTVTMGDHWKNGEVHDLVCALAAEVRALRKDRERLEWLLDLSKRTDVGVVTKTYGALVHYAGSREELDAAMAREGEA